MEYKRLEIYNSVSKSLNDIINLINGSKLLDEYYICSKENKYIKSINYIEKSVKDNIESIEELKKPFLLFVIGNGNYGKSTLINLLLKKMVVNTTDIPNTWKIDMFILNSSEKIEIIYENKNYNVYKFNKGKYVLEKEEEKYRVSKKKISKMVREYKNDNNYTSDKLKEIKINLEEKYLYRSDIREVHYYIRENSILEDFIIVDTPGFNQNLLTKTKNAMDYYYSRADGILWMLDAQNIISRESNILIKDMNEINRIAGNKKNIIGIVNKMDIIEKNNMENIKKVKSKTIEVFGDCFSDIIFISARNGLEGIINNNYDYIKSSNVNSLYTSIDNILKKTSEVNQINSKKANIIVMRKNILNEIVKYKRELYVDISKYNESEYSMTKQTENLKSYVASKLTSLANQNYSNINDSINMILDDIKNIENICNSTLKKIYNNLLLTSNISRTSIVDNLELNVDFIKNRHVSKIIKMGELG
ncbi:MAG: dynamin family protein, partial [Romboutsia sp.]|uniref:dynamin family protein n=1 Tax=Romboutsia sp. TaxID=1965302 RepID=UPI003F3630EA